MPSHCHLPSPLGAGAPCFGCQPPASVTCAAGGRAARSQGTGWAVTPQGLSGCPCGAAGPRGQAAAARPRGGASPTASAGAQPGHGWAGAEQAGHPLQKPGWLQDLLSLSTKTLLPPYSGEKARGRHLSQPGEPPPPPPCAPRKEGVYKVRRRKGFMESGDRYLLK